MGLLLTGSPVSPADCREILLPMMTDQLKYHLERQEDLEACCQLLSNILEVLYRKDVVSHGRARRPAAGSTQEVPPRNSRKPGLEPQAPQARSKEMAVILGVSLPFPSVALHCPMVFIYVQGMLITLQCLFIHIKNIYASVFFL